MYENSELKSELGLPTLSGIERVKAEVVSGAPSNFDQTITINQGERRGIKVGMPVITSGGLVGRVEQVTARQSVVRLLSDPESTVGVRFASAPCSTSARPPPRPRRRPRRRRRFRAAPPAGGPRPRRRHRCGRAAIDHRGQRAPLGHRAGPGAGPGRGQARSRWSRSTPRPASAVGDGVITAGVTESLFPRGIPIGRVNLVERRPGSLDLLVRVDPVVDLQRLSIVQVLLYDGDAAFAGS